MGEAEIKELESIKKLLILSLVNQGMSTDDIGKAIGVHGRTIRTWVPARKIKNK